MENCVIVAAKLWNGSVAVYADRVEIKRNGIIPLFYQGYSGGKKSIPISSITAVQFKKQGMKQGFIHFSVKGEGNFSRSYDQIVRDENTITFPPVKSKIAEKIRDTVEELIHQNHVTGVFDQYGQSEAADEIIKLKNLFDAGIISESEFVEAKRKLLGI